jgi:multiphosphoryl transfer protein
MPVEYIFRCPLANGLHARPASYLAEVAGRFQSRITLTNQRTGNIADAASVLDLVAAGVLLEDPCRLAISGPDEAAAHPALVAFIEQSLPGCDAPLPEPVAQESARPPRVLDAEDLKFIPGTPVSPGIGIGAIIHLGGLALPAALRTASAQDPAAERDMFTTALARVTAHLQAQLDHAGNHTAAEILRATLAIARDVALSRHVSELITVDHRTAAQAVVEAAQRFCAQLSATGSAYLRERIVDVQDIGAQLLEHICGADVVQPGLELTTPAIVCAANLAPRQLLALDREQLRGLVLTDAGATAHAVILARAFGIPVLTGAVEATALPAGQAVVLDADRGLLVTPVTPAVMRCYTRELAREQARQARLAQSSAAVARTGDGRRIEIAANIATAAEAAAAVDLGAEGVGLFRTEIIFTASDAVPAAEEQYAIYRQAVEAMQGRTVIFRTIDIGGDKPLPYLNLPREENPFLGYRGLRIYQEHLGVIESQLRAMLRASAHGPVWIMAPMVSTLEEAQWFSALVQQTHAALVGQGIPCAPHVPVGIMVEVPAAALIVDQLCAAVDFFSIGTNDLCQYLFAVDRGNRNVAGLYNPRHPAFLRLLHQITEAARRHGKWVGMCGEMARQEANAPLLVGLGLDELSLSASQIPALKRAIALTDSTACQALLATAMNCGNAAEVDTLLAQFSRQAPNPLLITEDLIQFDVDCTSKAEVLKELAGLLYVNGRTGQPDQVEDALWAREAAFSTGLGYGFAIPHCKTDSLSANSLAVLRLKQPVDWGAQDELPVRVALLLAIRESDASNTHMRIFSKLARKLMHEEFRTTLEAAATSAGLLDYLTQELEIKQEEV